MSNVAAGLHRKAEFSGSFRAPPGERFGRWWSAEAIVDLNGVEMLRVPAKHAGARKILRIKRSARVAVMPARRANMNQPPRLGTLGFMGLGAVKIEESVRK